MAAHLKDDILKGIQTALRHELGSQPKEFVALHVPTLDDVDKKFLNDCIDSSFVSSVSPYVGKFEAALAEITGSAHVVACVNGTAALHISCLLAGVKPGDEVLMPALTFIATANAVAYTGAVPHFVEVEEATLAVDPRALRQHLEAIAEKRGGVCVNKKTGRVIRALVVVHVFGHAADLEGLMAVCDEFGIELIEDAAESLGTMYKGKSLGTFAKIAATSFNGNKIMTTGGGGAIFCRDEETAKLAKHLTTTGKKPHPYLFEHDMLAYNYRLPGINAALGCAQISRVPGWFEKKRVLADRYREAFANVKGVRFFSEVPGSKANYWLNTLILESRDRKVRDEILEFVNGKGYMVRPIWTLMNRLAMYKDSPRASLEVSESLEDRVINIPSSPFLADGAV